MLLLFAAIGTVRHLDVIGEDLASSYVGCRVLAAGESSHLFDRDSELFNVQDEPSWTSRAVAGGFNKLPLLHPYVQTPLWAYALRPVCLHTSFPAFNQLFMAISMLCFAGTIWMVARHWTPRLFHPVWIALICVALYRTEPFRYALFLNQTHIIFIFLTVVALVAARRHPVWAGVLLAVAAAVKITPGFLLIYWLLTRQRRAAISFVVSSVALAGLTLVTTGTALMMDYIHDVAGISKVLLVAFNNQSFAGWALSRGNSLDELLVWHNYPLPAAMRWLSLLLCLGSSVAGGLLDRDKRAERPPCGAIFSMVGATLFTPIAWSHYFVLLIGPVMLMLEAARRSRKVSEKAVWLALVVAAFGLNLFPISAGAVHQDFTSLTVVHSQFYAGLLCLAGMLLMDRTQMWSSDRALSRSDVEERMLERVEAQCVR